MSIDEQPQSPAAATSAPAPADAPRQLAPEELAKWWARIEASEAVIEWRKTEWKKCVLAYMNKVLDALPKDYFVNVPLEFAYVELKKALLAFQVPELYLKPELPGLERAVPVFQGAMNHMLGPDEADVKTTVDEAITDTLTCSIGATKIGYVCEIRTRQMPVMVTPPVAPPAPMAGAAPAPPPPPPQPQPLIDPTTQQPVMQDEKYCAHEEYFWERFPIEDLLIPVDFTKSNFDKASWLGHRFFQGLDSAKKQYGLPDNFASTVTQPRETLSSADGPSRDQASYQEIEGYEIWYKTSLFEADSDALPGQYTKLVLIKGLKDRAAEWQPSPYQQIGADGKLHGMKGNPIHPLTLRFLPGSAYPVGDVEIGRLLSKELSLGRTQMIKFRNRALPMRLLNRDALDIETRDKIVNGDVAENITVDGNPNEVAAMLALPQMPRESPAINEMVMHDYQRTWASGATPGGQVEPEARTATEVQNAQGTADVRLDAERTRLLTWFCKGARKFGSLLQQFKTDDGYAEIVGADGVKELKTWNMKAIQGEFAFRAKPDSALRIDADVERRQAVGLYNLTGRDPNVNRVELLKVIYAKHNIDPEKIVVPTPPQQPHPDALKVSLSIKAEELGSPMVLAILQQMGIQLPTPQELQGIPGGPPGAPSPAAMPQAAHGGAMPQANPINKHQLDQDVGRNLVQ